MANPLKVEIVKSNLAFVESVMGKSFLRGMSKSYPDAGASASQGNVRFAKNEPAHVGLSGNGHALSYVSSSKQTVLLSSTNASVFCDPFRPT